MLTSRQLTDFRDAGITQLRAAFDAASARCMCDAIWSALAEEHGIRADDANTWPEEQVTGFQNLTRAGAFDALATPVLTGALDDLFDASWQRPRHWGAPLVTFPCASCDWELPATQWHLDFVVSGASEHLPGVRVLAFIAPVASRGGGTLVLRGSHRLAQRLLDDREAGDGRSSSVRQVLARRHEWLRSLWTPANRAERIRRHMESGTMLAGLEVRVVELTGNAGDIVLMHPWTFHAPSMNCDTTPRLMVSHSVFAAA